MRLPWYICPNIYANLNSYCHLELSFHKTCAADRLGPLYLLKYLYIHLYKIQCEEVFFAGSLGSMAEVRECFRSASLFGAYL